jgi:hypothetical protein
LPAAGRRHCGLAIEKEAAMATLSDHDQYLVHAAALTAKQLKQAIEIVEDKFGAERAQTDGALVGAVLAVLADNFRQKTR